MKWMLSAILVTIFLIGCTPMKLSVSEDLKASHDEYTVKGRQGILIKQKLSFGEFNTSRVKRSWTKGSSARYGIGTRNAQNEWVNLISTEYIDRKQTLNFSLSDGRNQSEVFCVSRFQSKDFQLGKSENSIVNIAMDIAGIGDKSSS